MPFPFPPEDKPWPYELQGQRPFEAPSILGVPTRTEFFILKEKQVPANSESEGAVVQFPRNAVVTAIHFLSNWWQVASYFNVLLQITKQGKEFLFHNGQEPVACPILLFAPYPKLRIPVWIPVDAGEIWRSEIVNNVGDPADYSVVLRTERLLEKPKTIPDWLPSSTFYCQSGMFEAAGVETEGFEFDFREDSIVTKLVCHSDKWVLGDYELQVLLDGQKSLFMDYDTATPVNASVLAFHELSTIWEEVSRRQKWSVFLRRLLAQDTRWGVGLRAEERRRPWERW